MILRGGFCDRREGAQSVGQARLNDKIINNQQLISPQMEAGRARNLESKMKGTINQDNKLTDIYLPRKCDYTDRIITSKDHSSIQLSIADVNEDGTINLAKTNVLTISGFVRSTGEGDAALQKVLRERKLI